MKNGPFTTEPPYRYPSLWDGCVGAWEMCLGPTGTILSDQTGFGSIGAFATLTAASWNNLNGLWSVQSAGTTGSKITFSATNPALALASADWSVSAWIQPNANVVYGQFVIMNGCGIGTRSDGANFYLIHNTGGYCYYPFTVGNLYHVCATRTGTTYKLWVNGTLATSNSGGEGGLASSGQYSLFATVNYTQCNMDSVRAYNRVLSFDEIQLLYSNGFGRGIAHTPAFDLAL